MRVEFLEIAEAELRDAVRFYNLEGEGLGFVLAAEVKRTIERIIQFPEAWQPLSERTRRCRMSRFPYGIVYQVREATILVIAVMHLHREPSSWRGRVPAQEE